MAFSHHGATHQLRKKLRRKNKTKHAPAALASNRKQLQETCRRFRARAGCMVAIMRIDDGSPDQNTSSNETKVRIPPGG